jgi:hypothetical protein
LIDPGRLFESQNSTGLSFSQAWFALARLSKLIHDHAIAGGNGLPEPWIGLAVC